jgi:hypothetical protein
MKYGATERRWVARILATLTPAERAEYERRCAEGGRRHHSTGRLYDRERARIAEQVKLEMRR